MARTCSEMFRDKDTGGILEMRNLIFSRTSLKESTRSVRFVWLFSVGRSAWSIVVLSVGTLEEKNAGVVAVVDDPMSDRFVSRGW